MLLLRKGTFPLNLRLLSIQPLFFYTKPPSKAKPSPLIFSAIKQGTPKSFLNSSKASAEDQKTRIELVKRLSACSTKDHSAILKEFHDKLKDFKDIYETKQILGILLKFNIRNSDFLQLLFKNFDETAFARLSREDQSFFIFALIRFTPYRLNDPEFFDFIASLYKRLFIVIMKDLQEKDLSLITVSRANNLLFAMHLYNYMDERFLSIYSEFFKKNLRIFSEKEYISSFLSFTKFYATFEKAAFVENKDTTQQKQLIRGLLVDSPDVINKMKSSLLKETPDLPLLVNLAYCISRLNFENNEIWNLLTNKLALHMKSLDDNRFRIALAALTAQGKCNAFLLTEFKSHFDARLTESPKELNPEYFVRCLRSFVNSNLNVINRKDPSLKLYEDFIEMKAEEFKLEQFISVFYFFSQINYENKTMIEFVLQRILEMVQHSDFPKMERLSLFFWSGSILVPLTNLSEKFWDLFLQYIQTVDFDFMNEKNLVNIVLPSYLWLKNNAEESSKNPSIISKLSHLRELAFNKVFRHSTPLYAYEGLDLYLICQSIGLTVNSEVLVEIYPVDYYLENFLDIDFTEKLKNVSQIANEFKRRFPGQGNKIKDQKCPFNSLQETEEYVNRTKEKALLIEVQGPTHYIMDEEEKTASKLKGWILKGNGFSCLMIKSSLCKEIGEIPEVEGKIRRVLEILQAKQEEVKRKIQENKPFPIGKERYFY